MAVCSKSHKELDENGIGKCSVPMWQNGLPVGFCGKAAYGKPTKCNRIRNGEGKLVRIDGKYSGYVPGLACPEHGGPQKPNKLERGEIRMENIKRVIVLMHKNGRPEDDGRISYNHKVIKTIHNLLSEEVSKKEKEYKNGREH